MPANKRPVIIVVTSLVSVAALIFVIRFLTTATLVINSPPGTDIYAQQATKEGFIKLGSEHAVFKTRSTDPVYVEVRKDAQLTQKTIQPNRRHTTDYTIGLKPLASTIDIADGSLTYPLITRQFLYGINPHTNSLVATPRKGVKKSSPLLPLLPFLKQIIWFDSQRFLYVTLGEGAGTARLGSTTVGQALPYIAAGRVKGTLALLASDGLYITKGQNIIQTTQIATLVGNSAPQVFTDKQSIYFGSLVYKPNGSEDNPIGQETKLSVFNSSGQKQKDFTLPLTVQIYKIASINNSAVGILSGAGLMLLDETNGQTRLKQFAFGNVQDLLVDKDQLLLLSDTGLWQYDLQNDISYRLATYPEGEQYVPNSLAVLGRSLYFSSSVTDKALLSGSSTALNRIYQVRLP